MVDSDSLSLPASDDGGLPTNFFEKPPAKAGAHWALKPMMWEGLGRFIDNCKPKRELEFTATAFFAGVAVTAGVGWLSVINASNVTFTRYALGFIALFAAACAIMFALYESKQQNDALKWHGALKIEFDAMTDAMHVEQEARVELEGRIVTR
jgi:hypothetical protein